MVRSLPEKTLEHWVSQYILYRFRSRAEVWWPTSGEDLSVASAPHRPGKLICLEIKTSEHAGDRHVVDIDLKQLERYLGKPLWRQPFYVFPLPPWRGVAEAASGLFIGSEYLRATELAFSRAGDGWFASWTFVMTAREIEAALGFAVTNHRAGSGGPVATLVTYDADAGQVKWPNAPVPVKPTPWTEFWADLEDCGRPNWPQLMLLPASAIPRGLGRMTHAQARQARAHAERSGEPAYVLLPDGQEGYEVVPYEVALGDAGHDQGRSTRRRIESRLSSGRGRTTSRPLEPER